MLVKIFSLAILLTGCFGDATDETKKTPDCRELNDLFIKLNHKFVACVLEHNEHATFCEECVVQYANATRAYNDLLTLSETDKNAPIHGPCRSRFVDANQLNLVDRVFEHTKRLWDTGDCSDCYSPNCNLTNYLTEPCPRSNHTLEFEDHLDVVQKCFNISGDIPSNKSTNGNNTCSHCTENYNDLSNFYTKIRLKTSDKFCFSMKYWMNTTQQHWANYLHCCEERKSSSLEDFSLASSFSITLSIAFYIVTFIMGKRKERVQEIPDDLMPARDADESGDTVMNISRNDPSTSESAGANVPASSKILNRLNDSSSGDDDTDNDDDVDILPIQNTNLIEIGQ